ncbi:MAG: hypothetical protein ACPGU5_06920 [Lishizhenia sp.]
MKEFKEKIDHRTLGIIVGLILPVISFFIYVQIMYSNTSLSGVFNVLINNSGSRFGPLTYSLIPNFVLFYLTNYQIRVDKFSYGLVISTMLLSLFVVFTLLF